MEDDLKILKMEYISNHLLNHSQIRNSSLDDQTVFYKSLKWRRHQKEDDFKILKREKLHNQLLSHIQNLNLSLDEQTLDNLHWKTISNGRRPPMEDDLHWKMISNGRWPPMEDDLKIWKVEYLCNKWSDLNLDNLKIKLAQQR